MNLNSSYYRGGYRSDTDSQEGIYRKEKRERSLKINVLQTVRLSEATGVGKGFGEKHGQSYSPVQSPLNSQLVLRTIISGLQGVEFRKKACFQRTKIPEIMFRPVPLTVILLMSPTTKSSQKVKLLLIIG